MFVATLLSASLADARTQGSQAASVLDGVSVMYNNDGENLMSVTSSYHPRGAPIDGSVIRGTVQDTSGNVDVNMICPFHNVPWWQSALEPPAAHREWYDATFNFSYNPHGGSQLDYVLRGGDFVGDFAEEAVKEKQKPFLTIRLNDGQMCDHAPTPNDDPGLVSNDHQFDRLSRFWWEHRHNASVILGLQQSPARGFAPCCWQDDPITKKPSCACPSAACEFSWTSRAARTRIAKLVGELASMYAPRGLLAGIELDFERGLDYFPPSTPLPTRRAIMHGWLVDVRQRIEVAGADELALGLRLSPHWDALRAQGLDDLRALTTPVESGGAGVTYFTWGVFFWGYQPFDSDLASLAAATRGGTPFFFEVAPHRAPHAFAPRASARAPHAPTHPLEGVLSLRPHLARSPQVTSWVEQGPVDEENVGGKCVPPKVRVTKEELWTTALLARSYGARGLSAFNFIYTRQYYDFPCEEVQNLPYSEPLFDALGATRNATFLDCCADQFYRLAVEHNPNHGQIGGGLRLNSSQAATLRIVAVRPTGGWRRDGKLRLRLNVRDAGKVAARSPSLLTFPQMAPRCRMPHADAPLSRR